MRRSDDERIVRRGGVMGDLALVAAIENLAAGRTNHEMLDIGARIGLIAHFFDVWIGRALHPPNLSMTGRAKPFSSCDFPAARAP